MANIASADLASRPTLTAFGNGFRQKRLRLFWNMVDDIIAERGQARILDLGGTVEYWQRNRDSVGDRPIRVTIVNLSGDDTLFDPRFMAQAGDARHLPEFADNAFDIVHSNSVIEHVGRWADQKSMAAEVRRLAPRHFIQVPAAGFPVEPHFRTPFFHWLPEPLRLRLIMAMPLGAYPRAQTVDEAMSCLEDAILLTRRQMQVLFPDSRIEAERVLGLTKSHIAIR